jgi:chromate reductase
MPTRDVAVIVGSLRKDAFSGKIARQLVELAPARLTLQQVEIRDLSLYDQDLEEKVPAPWAAFRQRIKRADAVLFVTPEYNRSVPAPLKNAIDVGSRPYGHNAWAGKPAAIVSTSPGALGGFGANHHLRQSMVFLDMPVLQAEAYLSHVHKLLDDTGQLVDDKTRGFLEGFLEQFDEWIELIAHRPQGMQAA